MPTNLPAIRHECATNGTNYDASKFLLENGCSGLCFACSSWAPFCGLTYVAGNPSKCKPLLVAYGGALDSQTGIVKGLATRLENNISGVVLYHTYDEEFISSNLIREHLKRFPSSPVVLMGHSYGGDTAYGAAEGWNRNIRLLVTLDPVSGRAYPPRLKFTEFKRHLKRPSNVTNWINVFIDIPEAL